MQDSPKGNNGQFLSIGALAKSFGINESTIRRAEAAGLLKPALVVSGSGYRYYDRDNVFVLAEILALKSCGFVQDDIRDYFSHPGDYSGLYKKLQEKQDALNLLIERFKRRAMLESLQKCEVLVYDDAFCICKKVRLQLTPETAFDYSKDFLFETIQDKIPINYTRAMLIRTENMDYRAFDIGLEQEYTFCIPLSKKVEHQQRRFFPSSMALRLMWNDPQKDYSSFIPLIDELTEHFGLVQSDKLSITYEIGGYLEDRRERNRILGHILIPVCDAKKTVI